MLLSLAGAAAGLSLLGDVVTSSIASRQPPALAQLPAALATVAAEDYCPVIPPDDPDFFDYDCQQSKVQVLVRGGRPLIMAQSWTSGDTASTGASVWPSSVILPLVASYHCSSSPKHVDLPAKRAVSSQQGKRGPSGGQAVAKRCQGGTVGGRGGGRVEWPCVAQYSGGKAASWAVLCGAGSRHYRRPTARPALPLGQAAR